MKTNLEKWNYYLGLLNKKADAFMDEINPIIPSVFYKVHLNGTLNICSVINRHYSFRGLYFNGSNPTKKDVSKIMEFLNSKIVFDSENAFFDYSYVFMISEDGQEKTAETAIKITDVFDNKMAFLSLSEAELKASEIVNKNEEERLFQETHKKDANYNYIENGYKFLGWQNGWNHRYFDENGNVTNDRDKAKSFGYLTEDYPEYGKCRDEKHRTIKVSHNNRGSENTVSCPTCKIYYKYDCSD